jgi:hypothetical protein
MEHRSRIVNLVVGVLMILGGISQFFTGFNMYVLCSSGEPPPFSTLSHQRTVRPI